MPDLVLVARLVLGLVFLTSGGSKFQSSSALVQTIQQFGAGHFGPKLPQLLARFLPPGELLLGLLFLSGLWLTLVACAALGALVTFTLAMTMHLAQGHRFRCTCFGSASSEIGIGSLCRNVVLLTGCLFLLVSSPWTSVTVPLRADAQRLSDPTTLALVLAGCSVYVMLLAVGEIDRLFRSPRASKKGV
ncbi:MAG TPA: MauE/DoxX family redox-associated membrane protein [Ktedonobacterales bacterium]|nr:MauE/DoxX family redox-associated membrane protein [Ktedonobacterales bacterium]